jgi:hypothetical protein
MWYLRNDGIMIYRIRESLVATAGLNRENWSSAKYHSSPTKAFTVVGQFNLRFGISARHDIRILQFRYYVEEFGAFMLPDPVLAVHAGKDSLAATQPMLNGR